MSQYQYKNAFWDYLFRQMRRPSGPVGAYLIHVWNKTFKNETRWGLQFVTIRPADTILDIGCGGGATVQYLTEQVINGKVFGIDASLSAIAISKKVNQIAVAKAKVSLQQTSAEALPFDAAEFDLITAVQTHIYWSELTQALTEIHRVLKDTGQFLIICEKDKIAFHLPPVRTPWRFQKFAI